MKIYLGADHGGYKLKEKIKDWLTEWGFAFEDIGAHALIDGDDYPDYAETLSRRVSGEKESLGILACRSGQGACIAANKIKNIRAALAWSQESIIAGRNDDDVNVVCLSADYVGFAEQRKIVAAFISTPFGNDERYQRRIDKISKLEQK